MPLPDPLPIEVRLYLTGDPEVPSTWADPVELVSGRWVRRDAGIRITTGRPDEGSTVDASRCDLSLDNRDGRFSRHNRSGPWFGQLRRGNPLEVVWTDTVPESVLFAGAVDAWPTRWDPTAEDSVAPITVHGPLHRIRLRSEPFLSALRRQVTMGATTPVGYWPCEDTSDATAAASVLAGVPPMQPVVVAAHLADDDEAVRFGSQALTDGSTGAVEMPPGRGLRGQTRREPITTGWTVDAWHDFGDSMTDPRTRWNIHTPGGDGIQEASILFQSTGYSSGVIRLNSGVEETVGIFSAPGVTVSWPSGDLTGVHHLALVSTDTGAHRLYLDGTEIDTSASGGFDANPVSGVTVGCTASDDSSARAAHIVAWGSDIGATAITERQDPGAAFAGETAADRITRLSDEEGLPVTIIGTAVDSMPMGPQSTDTYLALVRECEATDGGLLHEHVGALRYATRTSRYNQPVALALDISSGDVADPPEPTDDVQQLTNDVTVRRTVGGEGRARDEASIGEAGRHPATPTLNLDEGIRPVDVAGWLLHIGTVDEARWPLISLRLDHHPENIDDWLGLSSQPGQRLTVDHQLAQLLGSHIDVLVDGWTQHIDPFVWHVEMNCVPAEPWRVLALNDATYGRLDTQNSELAAQFVAGTDTSMSVVTNEGPPWTTDIAGLPFQIEVDGVALNVTAVSGASSPQTFTVDATPTNGVTKTIAAGAAVALYRPPAWAL